MTGQRLVIVGGGATAELVANALAHALGAGRCSITVIRKAGADDTVAPFSPCDVFQPGPDQVGPATTVGEDLLVTATGASFTYGLALTGWSQFDGSYFHPFAPAGASFGPVPFPQIVQKMRRSGGDLRFSSYSLASMAALAGRFTRPVNEVGSVLSTCAYGIHADMQRLALLLRKTAGSAGIRFVDGGIGAVERGESGDIDAVRLADGTRIDGDLFFDCSSDCGLLGHLGDPGWQSWQEWLPADRYVTARVDPDPVVAPYSQALAFDAGWIHYVPTQHSASTTVFYRDGEASAARARELLLQFAGGDTASFAEGETRFGRRAQFWSGNCIAMGPAAVRIDPVGSSNLALLQRAIANLLQLLPGDAGGRAEASEFNRRMQTLCDRARDFAFLHYRLNGRHGEPFWDRCRTIAAPDALAYTMRLYRSTGRVVLCDEEPFDEASWVNLFDEHGILPRQDYRVADGIGEDVFRDHLDRMRGTMIDELRRMPLHNEYLAGLGGHS